MEKLNILVVDDKPENIIALEALISRDDVQLFSTTSPNDALKIAWQNDISLALVDVQMPGMDGFELVEMLKSNSRTKDILVIFVTAISKESRYAIKGFEVGAVDYLYKPLDPNITIAKVDSFIQLARAQHDIKQKNAQLAKYEVTIANSSDIICLLDKKNEIEFVNLAIEKTLGYSQDFFLGSKIYALVSEEYHELLNQKLLQLKETETLDFEIKLKHKDGHLIWAECRATCNASNFFLNIRDLSTRKKAEEELILSREEAIQAKQVKEKFLANMSHELRTPLNGIIGISNLLKQTPLEENQKKMVNLLETSSQSLLGVVNDVLDLSKISAGKFAVVKKEVNLSHLLTAAVELLRFKATEKLIDLKLELDQRLPLYLETDPLRLNQILMNLLSNSLKFTEKGFVKLSAEMVAGDEENIHIKFTVEDTGIGIHRDRHSKIFESYEQAENDTALKYGGTGLGLGIVKKLVELLGGDIDFESEYGTGSKFYFTLPFKVTQESIENASADEKQLLKPFENLKVLVAEDNLVNQFMIGKILKNWNIESDLVEDGELVLEKLEDNDYDLILMDTHMPNLGGYETTRRIRNDLDGTKKDIPIVSLSAAVLEEEKKAALEVGMNYVLTKPFLPNDMYRIIEKIVAGKSENT